MFLRLPQNLLSVAQILEKGHKVSFENKVCVIKNTKVKEECARNKVSMKE